MGSSDKHKAYAALGVVSFFWGTTWFVSKLTVQYLPALQLTAIRNIIAGLLLIIYFMRSEIKLPSAKEFGYLFLSGFLLIACSNGLTTIAIKFIPSFLGALISCLSPFVFVLANFIFFKEKTNARAILGLVIGFSGIALLLTSFRQEMSDPNFALGIALSLLAVITWPMGTLLTLPMVKRKANI
jgi:drug/metabolite transporter (DMT)-like permease